MIDMLDSKSILKWKLYFRPELPTWSHPSGKFTLLGDAVHATLPYVSQGAGLCIEDADVLGLVLERCSSPADLPKALRVYEACRIKRTSRIVRQAATQQFWMHLPDGRLQQWRDMRMATNDPPKLAVEADDDFADWLFTYDTVKDVSGPAL
jgi:salicylate hydroxylase